MDTSGVVAADRRLNGLNTESQKKIVSDTGKLLILAKELNDEVAVGNAGALTEAELRQVAEIEKLARRIRKTMADRVPRPEPGPIAMPYYPRIVRGCGNMPCQ
jgi:hypothetical protein